MTCLLPLYETTFTSASWAVCHVWLEMYRLDTFILIDMLNCNALNVCWSVRDGQLTYVML